MAVSELTWRSTLQETRRQALLHLQPSIETVTQQLEGDWLSVDRNSIPAMDGSLAGDAPSLAGSHEWPPQQWHTALEILFFQAPECVSAVRGHDDLLFFVYTPAQQRQHDMPTFVRRKGKALPADLQSHGEKFALIDWRKTVLLNMVLQTRFVLTVASCE